MADAKSYVKEYNEGDIIFCEFEPGNTFYMITKGRVRVSKISEDYEKTLDVLEEGSLFGEMAIIESAPRSATLIAETDVSLTEFTKDNFKAILAGHPELLSNLIRILCQRIYEAKRRLSVLQIKDDEGKLIDVILMLVENAIRKNSDLAEERLIPINTTIADLGYWCGLKEDEAKQIIYNLEKAGQLEAKPGMIVIKNLPDLIRIVERKKKMAQSGLLE